jgi:hypothetical protein
MFKLYYIFVWFFASFYFLSAQTVYYSSSPVPSGGIKTPKGSPVSSGGTNETRTLQQRQDYDAEKIQGFANAQLLYDVSPDNASSLKTYNCHGYAWIYTDYATGSGLRRTLSTGSDQFADIYTTDGSYIEITHRLPGAKVFHHNHSAVIYSDTNYYISKWEDCGPLVRHLWNDSPYNSQMSAAKYYMQPNQIPIEGSSPFCGATTFRVPVPATGHTFSWSVTSGFTISGANNQSSVSVSVSAPSTSGTLTVAIDGGTGSAKGVTLTRSISSNCPVSPSISGPATVCAGKQAAYTVSNPPSGYSWAKSGNLTAGTSSGNTYTVTASTMPGSATVSIVSGGSTAVSKSISVVALPASRSITGYPYFYVYEEGYYEVSPKSVSNETVSWSITPTTGVVLWDRYHNDGSIYIVPNSNQDRYYGSYQLKATITNSNGCTTEATTSVSILDHPSPSASPVYPNPVNDILTVDLDAITAVGQRQSLTYDIRIYDMQGNMQRQTPNSKGGKITFNLSNLPDGSYFLHIYDGIKKTPEIYKILVKH